ncbi:MAG: YCF48-related protein [Gammaproteobacteria bacterium]|nr:YCF48-related protein [Gammaproteobacteria bacterium]
MCKCPLRKVFRGVRARDPIRTFGAVLLLAVITPSPAAEPAIDVRSEPARLAPRSLLLDAAAINGKIVVVGERGHILLSMDGGLTWNQVQAPTRATLTAVYFVNDNIGYAAGHDAVILKTEDGGSTWSRVHYAPDEERPLFDIWFKTPQDGVAVGAYGYYLETRDGGQTWTDRILNPIPLPEREGESEPEAPDEQLGEDLHLNRIVRSDTGKLYLAAEAGTVYRSDNEGQSWFRLPSPYEGSFFGVLPLSGDSLLVFGLEGRLFRTDDAGRNWERVDTGTEAILMDGVRLRDGTLVIVGFAGTLLSSIDGGRTFQAHQQKERAGLATIVQPTQGALVLVGENGVRRIEKQWGARS